MAIILLGKSLCPVCGEILNAGKSVMGFPPFVRNMHDALALFNDAGVHEACLRRHPFGERAIELLARYSDAVRRENRICAYSGNIIVDYDRYFFLGLLTSDPDDELYRYNFVVLDKEHIGEWAAVSGFASAMRDAILHGWSGWSSGGYFDEAMEIMLRG